MFYKRGARSTGRRVPATTLQPAAEPVRGAVTLSGTIQGLICPLTPLEVHLRQLGGEAGYSGGFIEHYVGSVLYPSGLTRAVQVWLGIGAAVFNVGVYSYVVLRRRRRSFTHT